MLITQDNIDEVWFYIKSDGWGIQTLKGTFGLSLLLLIGIVSLKLLGGEETQKMDGSQDDESADAFDDYIQFKHILACLFGFIHAFAMLLHA